jgi:cell division protein FtsB
MLHELPDDLLAAISPDDGWFVFAVVRHPAARVWAAWQSKFLLREPRWIEEFAGAPWLPRVPESSRDVVEDFRRFVDTIASDPVQPVMHDRHFMSQTQLVAPERTPYTKVYETAEIPLLLDDLRAHLRAQGWDGTLSLGQRNETPLAPLASVFTPTVIGGIRSVYSTDFDAFGYTDPLPPKTDPADEYPRSLLLALGRITERGERLGDLALRAQSLSEDNRALRTRNKTLRGENKTLRADNKTLRSENKTLRARPGVRSIVRRAYRKLSAPR